jgi:hypothetical protein
MPFAATRLTEQKRLGPETFAALSRQYSEREWRNA